MDSSRKKISDTSMEIAPLRPLSEFLLEDARFQVPKFHDLDRWNNRVLNNLLYYQTNYFLLGVAAFTLVGIIHPVRMLSGIIAMIVTFALFIVGTETYSNSFRERHPFVGIFVILAGAYFVLYLMDSIVVFVLGITLPLNLIFIHASLRLRNIKNKIVNKTDILRNTPMMFFLESMGFELNSLL